MSKLKSFQEAISLGNLINQAVLFHEDDEEETVELKVSMSKNEPLENVYNMMKRVGEFSHPEFKGKTKVSSINKVTYLHPTGQKDRILIELDPKNSSIILYK